MPENQSVLFKEWSSFKDLDSNRKLLVMVMFILLLGFGFFLGSQTGNPNNPIGTNISFTNQQPAPTSKPMTNIMVIPSATTGTVGQAIPVSVKISGSMVQAADVSLSYDPTMVTVSNVTEGTALPQILRNQPTRGKIAVSAAVDLKKPFPATTDGDIFIFTVTPIKSGTAQLTIDTKETILANSGVNILGTIQNASITVK